MADLTIIPTFDLQQELDRRKREEKEKREKYLNGLRDNFCNGLTKEMVNALTPEHGRTSCNDEKPANGFGSNGDGVPRCSRCGLLEALNTGYIPEGLIPHFNFEAAR